MGIQRRGGLGSSDCCCGWGYNSEWGSRTETWVGGLAVVLVVAVALELRDGRGVVLDYIVGGVSIWGRL